MSATPIHVLVVDDQPTLLRILDRILVKMGYEATTACNCAAALEFLDRRPVDIVITDETMPDMNGRQLAAVIRGKFPGLPVVLLSGMANFADLEDGLFDAALAKPLDFEKLRETVARLTQPACEPKGGKPKDAGEKKAR